MSLPETSPQPDPNQQRRALDPAVFGAWQEGDHDAGEAIVLQFRRFVGMVAGGYDRPLSYYSGGTIDQDDLKQVGELSVARQATRFDATRGNTFLTFAHGGIRGVITYEFFLNRGAVHVPHHRRSLFVPFQYERERRQIAGEPPMTSQEIGNLLFLDINGPAIVEEITEPFTVPNFRLSVSLGEAMSLDRVMKEIPGLFESAISVSSDHYSVVHNTEETALRNVVRAKTLALIDKAFTVERKDFKSDAGFEAAKSRLSRHRQVVLNLFGFKTGSAKTLDETAKDFDVTPERIRQIRVVAIARLKKFAELPEFAELADEMY